MTNDPFHSGLSFPLTVGLSYLRPTFIAELSSRRQICLTVRALLLLLLRTTLAAELAAGKH